MKSLICATLCFVMPGICVGQTTSSSEQSLQAILSELRSIHSEIRAETARSQSMQLLLAELQVQSEALARATQRVDAARSMTSGVQEGVRRATADLTRAEEAQTTAAMEADKTRVANEVSRLKDGLASMKRQEQDRSSNQQEAEAALQRVQAAYDGVENQLSALMKTLRASSEVDNK
jgi:uncharacterized protein YoxC